MQWQKVDKLGYQILGRGYLYLNIFFDVIDYCKETVLGPKHERLKLEDDEEWQDFLKWRSRHDSNVRPLDS